MVYIIAFLLFTLAAVAVLKFLPNDFSKTIRNVIAGVLGCLGLTFFFAGAFEFNDAGTCQHIRTIAGTEDAECKAGWYFSGFGKSTPWPWGITISHTNNPNAEGSEVSGPYSVRMADNWTGEVTQTTRFEIPQDTEQFLNMARKLRTPERLISTTLRPAVISSLDSIANLYTMEQYYAGGQRDQFKTEFKEALEKGRAQVRQVTIGNDARHPQVSKAAANDLDAAEDTSEVGELGSRQVVMEKVLDSNGNEIRLKHDFADYGIVVGSAILENLDPDDKFEEQIQARKDAASRRIVAQEQRKEQEEQRLLAIQTGETNIATSQATAKVDQIKQTTEAETEKKLALIAAARLKEEAEVQKSTAAILLEKAKLDAQARQVTADAEAYAKKAIIEADNALKDRLDAFVEINKHWAQAASTMNVPSTVMGGTGATGNTVASSDQFMQIMTMKAAKDLGLDLKIDKK